MVHSPIPETLRLGKKKGLGMGRIQQRVHRRKSSIRGSRIVPGVICGISGGITGVDVDYEGC